MSKMSDRLPLEHPPEASLEDLVAGELFPAERALLEAHLDKCRSCREKLASLSAPAGEMLRSFKPDALASGSAEVSGDFWHKLQAALPDLDAGLDPFAGLPVPQVCRDELNVSEPLSWEEIGPARVARVAADPVQDYVCFVIKTPGASVFPHHRHLGTEDLVVLQGGLTDDFGHMGVGDYRQYPAGSAHAPLMDTGPLCVALTLIRGGLEFSS